MRVVFPNKNADHEEFQRFLENKYPRLKAGGWFEVLRAVGGGQRPLVLLPPSKEGYTIPYLRERLNAAVGYIKPLQADLDETTPPFEEVR